MSRKIAVAVTNDLSTDNRVQRSIAALRSAGVEVVFIGRKLPTSQPFNPEYATVRFTLFFKKGALFYAEYNLRLFLFLLLNKFDGYLANDLDTLLAMGMMSGIKRVPFVYDSHEYFTGVPEIQGRPTVIKVWSWIEKRFYHKASARITVNTSIAELLMETYGGDLPFVVRNIGVRPPQVANRTRSELGLPEGKFIFINQGAGINVDRGMEEAVDAIEPLDAVLLIVGNGDAVPKLKQTVEERGMQDKVIFVGKVPYNELLSYTRLANVGLSLDKPTSVNYKFSLPNKLFDYLHSGIPVLTSQVVEVKRIVDTYQVGVTVNSADVEALRAGMVEMMDTPSDKFEEGITKAQKELTWDQERVVLLEALGPLINVQ